jgi:hypothetical protein
MPVNDRNRPLPLTKFPKYYSASEPAMAQSKPYDIQIEDAMDKSG